MWLPMNRTNYRASKEVQFFFLEFLGSSLDSFLTKLRVLSQFLFWFFLRMSLRRVCITRLATPSSSFHGALRWTQSGPFDWFQLYFWSCSINSFWSLYLCSGFTLITCKTNLRIVPSSLVQTRTDESFTFPADFWSCLIAPWWSKGSTVLLVRFFWYIWRVFDMFGLFVLKSSLAFLNSLVKIYVSETV